MTRTSRITHALATHAYIMAGNEPPNEDVNAAQLVIARRSPQYAPVAKLISDAVAPLSLVAIVSGWADRIHNGRTLRTVLKSVRDETDELEEEIVKVEQGEPEGPDGVFGEAVDVIASALDAIRMVRPNVPIEELEVEVAEYLDRKCVKWARKYG